MQSTAFKHSPLTCMSSLKNVTALEILSIIDFIVKKHLWVAMHEQLVSLFHATILSAADNYASFPDPGKEVLATLFLLALSAMLYSTVLTKFIRSVLSVSYTYIHVMHWKCTYFGDKDAFQMAPKYLTSIFFSRWRCSGMAPTVRDGFLILAITGYQFAKKLEQDDSPSRRTRYNASSLRVARLQTIAFTPEAWIWRTKAKHKKPINFYNQMTMSKEGQRRRETQWRNSSSTQQMEREIALRS